MSKNLLRWIILSASVLALSAAVINAQQKASKKKKEKSKYVEPEEALIFESSKSGLPTPRPEKSKKPEVEQNNSEKAKKTEKKVKPVIVPSSKSMVPDEP